MKANVGISLNSMISDHSLYCCEDGKERNDELQSLQLQLEEVQLHLQSLQHHYQTFLEDNERCFTDLAQIAIPLQSSSFQSFSSIISSFSSSFSSSSSSSCRLDETLCDQVMEKMEEVQAEIWNEIKIARLELYSPVLSRTTIGYLCDEEKRQSEETIIHHNTVKNGFLGMVVEQFRMNSSSSWKSFEKCFHQLLSPYFSVLLCNTYADAKVYPVFSFITTFIHHSHRCQFMFSHC